MIERERELRKNLEDKLMETKLVDMYSDPAVNEELHDRLPRAAKQRLYSTHGTPRSRSTGSKHRRKQKSARSEDEHSGSADEADYAHKHHQSYPGAMMHPSFYGSPGFYGGWPPGPGMMYPPPFAQQSTPNNAAQQSSQQPAFSHPMMSPPWMPGGMPTSGPAAGGDGIASQGVKTEEIDVIKAASMLSVDSKERQLARLLQEIDLLKDQNRKISGELVEQISECNRLKVENEIRSVGTEEAVSSRISALIQEIYKKQKQRDQAMLGRLKLANEERDQAVSMAKALKEGQSMTEILSDDEDQYHKQSRKSMMSRLDIQYDTSDILDTIHGSTQRSRVYHSEKLKSVAAERDTAQQKVQQLEVELLRLQREVEEITPIQEEHIKVQRQLSMTQQERDMVLTKLRVLEEENNNLKIYYGLHKSLSKEQSWKEQYNNSLNQMQQLIAQRDGNVLDAQKETNNLQEVIQELTEERDLLSQDREKLQASETEHQRVNEKLQRHVSVLQKKLKKLSQGDQGTV